MADREAEIKSLQELLSEATKAKEALQASQSSQSSQSDQTADVRAAGDSSQAVQEELGRLRQEVSVSSVWLVRRLIGKDCVKPKRSRNTLYLLTQDVFQSGGVLCRCLTGLWQDCRIMR